MGFLGKIGGTFKRWTTPPRGSFLEDVFGDSVLDEIGTGVGFALGGPAGAGLGGGLGTLAATGDLKKGLGSGLKSYAMGTGAQALGVSGGSMSLPGLGGGGAASAATTGSKGAALVPKVAGMAGGGGGAASAASSLGRLGSLGSTVGGLAKQGAGYLLKNPDLVLGTLGAVQSAQQNGKANDMRERAFRLAEEEAASRRPLQQAALGRLLAAGSGDARPDLSGELYDPGNPYARRPALGAGTAPIQDSTGRVRALGSFRTS